MDERRIPDGAIQTLSPHALGSLGRVDLRMHALRTIERALKVQVRHEPALALHFIRLRVLAERIAQLLRLFHDALLGREEAERQISEEQEQIRERLSEVPNFIYDEGRATARARYGLEDRHADLQRELREEGHKWLETRADIEDKLAEHFAEYCETLAKIELVTHETYERPSLKDLSGFLDKPQAYEVLVLGPPEEVKRPAPRIP